MSARPGTGTPPGRTGDIAEHVGPLRLPFASMWIEWLYPATEPDGTPSAQPEHARTWSCLVEVEEPAPDAPAGSVQLLRFTLFLRGTDAIVQLPETFFVFVGEHGEYLDGAMPNPDAEEAVMVRQGLVPAYLAIGLMNCKNVAVTEQKDRDRSSKRRNPGTPKPLSHHVISLPGRARPTSGAEARTAAGGAAPWHIVRGHFKTYTADAPLLGKHVGTFWWRDTVRGDSDSGRVETTYRVAPPASDQPARSD